MNTMLCILVFTNSPRALPQPGGGGPSSSVFSPAASQSQALGPPSPFRLPAFRAVAQNSACGFCLSLPVSPLPFQTLGPNLRLGVGGERSHAVHAGLGRP